MDKAQELTALEALTAERDQLAAQVEEIKALFVDAIGDGWYDGYLACKKDIADEHFDIDTVNDSDLLQWSECYESAHNYSKSITCIRAQAIRKFVSDTIETDELSYLDCQWLEDWCDAWLDETSKEGE